GIFEPIWNRRYVDAVQISVAESIGIGERGRYYDQTGALRDMVPNHLFQLLSMTAMEPPNSFDAEEVRDAKVRMLRAIKPMTTEAIKQQIVYGQYQGYGEEPYVKRNSKTETFVAMRLDVDNWRWAGVPFFLRTGKRLARRATEIVVQFKPVPFQ